jgi:hypothetical protein
MRPRVPIVRFRTDGIQGFEPLDNSAFQVEHSVLGCRSLHGQSSDIESPS